MFAVLQAFNNTFIVLVMIESDVTLGSTVRGRSRMEHYFRLLIAKKHQKAAHNVL